MKTTPSLLVKIVSLVLFCSVALISHAQNFSGLQGKRLTPDLSKESVIEQILGMVTSETPPNGTITEVKVLDDQDVSLTIAVTFTGFDGAYIHMTLTDNDLNPLKGFETVKALIEKDKKTIHLRTQLDPKSYGENETFTAPRLLLTITKTSELEGGTRKIYTLKKKFQNPITAENIVIAVTPAPVGSAASLPAQLPAEPGNGGYKLAIPRRNVYEVIKDKPMYLYKSTAISTVTPAAPSAPAPTQPAPAERKVLVRPMVMSKSILHSSAVLATPVATQPGSQPEPPSVEPQGPDNNPVSFWGDFIYSDVDFESQMKITSVNLNIYPDKNPHSGVFYYLPIAYDIRYDKEKGFAFNIDYGTSRGADTESKVRMSGTLASGISLYEVQFIANLMEAYRKQNPGLKFEKPRPLPVKETPVITLGDELKNFGITSVNINNVSSITDPIEFSWQTDGTTAAELENLLRVNSGIIGKMKIKPQSETLPVQEIPVRIRLIDENTFGRFGMTSAEVRSKNWRNETPFPVKLKYLHYMIIDKNRDGKESPIIYSWDLNNREIAPRMQVKFDASTIPQWLDNYKGKQARIWMEYSVVSTCTTCNEKVFADIVSSTTRPQLSDVVIRVIDFFEAHKIAYMDVEMKSKQGDPSGKIETIFPALHVTKDKSNYTAGKIYVTNGTDPSFDYRVTIVTQDGQEMTSSWITRNTLSVPFGSHQLLELFPSLKPEDTN
jgi:hypothetical protein